MNTSQLLCLVVTAAAIILATGGCGETNDDRRQISQHTKNLAAAVKTDPNSAEGQAAMKELVDILNGNWSFARSQACYAIDELDLGPAAAPAVPALMRAASSHDMFVEGAAVRALKSLGPTASPAVGILIKKVDIGIARYQNQTGNITRDAAEALGNVGKPALKAIPVLERAAGHDDQFLAEEATKSLEKLRSIAGTDLRERQPPAAGERK